MAQSKKKTEDVFLMGLGLLSMSKDRVSDMVDFFVQEGKLAMKDQKKLKKQLLTQGGKEYKKMMGMYEKTVQSTLKVMNVPTRKEFDALKKKVDGQSKKKKK